jgi:hypothetical protein
VGGVYATRLDRQMMVNVPLCRRHRHHWRKRSIIDAACFVILITVGFGGALSLDAPWMPAGWRDDVKSGLLPAILVILVAWPTIHLLVGLWMIEPRRIRDQEIVLRNVHPSFEDAVRRWRIGEFEDTEPATLVESKPPPEPNSGGRPSEQGTQISPRMLPPEKPS